MAGKCNSITMCSSEYVRTNLIFRNTSRARDTAIYTDVVKQLKERLGSRGENFPFDVTQTRNKFKKCVAERKTTAVTIKTAWDESAAIKYNV